MYSLFIRPKCVHVMLSFREGHSLFVIDGLSILAYRAGGGGCLSRPHKGGAEAETLSVNLQTWCLHVVCVYSVFPVPPFSCCHVFTNLEEPAALSSVPILFKANRS